MPAEGITANPRRKKNARMLEEIEDRISDSPERRGKGG
jgi:hypothetical protein